MLFFLLIIVVLEGSDCLWVADFIMEKNKHPTPNLIFTKKKTEMLNVLLSPKKQKANERIWKLCMFFLSSLMIFKAAS